MISMNEDEMDCADITEIMRRTAVVENGFRPELECCQRFSTSPKSISGSTIQNGKLVDDNGARGGSHFCRWIEETASSGSTIDACAASGLSTLAENRKRKLVLHFDIRNTILVSDSATHDDVEQALNSFLTGVTWGREDPERGWVWYSDRPSLTSPCAGAMTYYKSRERELVRSPADRVLLRRATGDFTRQPIGSRFRSYFDKHLKLLEWNATVPTSISNGVVTGRSSSKPSPHLKNADEKHYNSRSEVHIYDDDREELERSSKRVVTSNGSGCTKPEVVDRRLTISGADGHLYHYLLPSFVKLLYDLHSAGRTFSVVLRTYGVDAPKVLESIEHIIAGNHPLFPGRRLPIPVRRTPGRIQRGPEGLIRVETNPPEVGCSDADRNAGGDVIARSEVHSADGDIYRLLSDSEGISGFVDDFSWWQSHEYRHDAAKPFYLDPADRSVHHIFFDDNLRVADEDSIVDVRLFDDPTSGLARSLALHEIAALDGVCLVQADLLACTSNPDYFLERVVECERNFDAWLNGHTKLASDSGELLQLSR